ncbi:MAG: LamG domain-containing protein [Proteobacteria bacterium]|nr:LamG domain-containing protein [Pseudomonadota bacterium]NBP12876.1 LamG domain-containing protein [bacterium]
MDHSKTVYLNTATQAITGLSPFTLTINPSSISTSSKIYKIRYDYGDGTIIDRVLTPDNDSDFLKTLETHVFSLTGNLQKTFNVNVHAYQFNSSLYSDYTISLNLKTPPIESTTTTLSSLSSYAYFKELHLVGTRMFGTENEVLYMFESINPNYILPVLVNWKARPIENIVRTIDNSYAPYKLLAPFENEFTTSIDTGTNIVTFPDVNAAPNPDYGSPNMALYEGDGIATIFLGTVDGNWFNLANWKTEGGNNPLFLPDEYVSVKIYAPLNVSAVNVGEAAVINFYENSLLSQLTVMAAQSAIFNSNSYNLGTIDGNAYFLDNSYNLGYEPTLILLNGEGSDGSTTFTDSSTYNRILTYTGNPFVTSVPVTPNTIITDGLAFQVDAEGYTGDGSTWVDTVSGVVGTAQNSPTYVATSPSYFDFSGASQCFNFTRYNSAVNLNNNFTLETWVNVRGNNEWGGIISLATGGSENFGRGYGEQYSLNTTAGQYFRFDVNTGSYLNGISYTLNNWTHIVATYESGVVKTYKNGLLVDTQTIASTANTIIDAYLALGVNQYGGFEYLNGKIATARIYNKVLSSTEALQNFNATKERFGITHPLGSFIYFDGSSYINPVSGGNDFAFDKGDFTVEAWIYPLRTDQVHVFYDTRTYYAPIFPVFYIRYGVLAYFDGSGDRIYGTDPVPLKQWSHVALSRNGNKTRIFLNGKQTGGTFTDNNIYQSPVNRPMIGRAFDGGPYYGFIEDLRVTKGTAKYTGSYTVPTSTLNIDPYVTGDVTGTAFFRDNSINYGTLTNAVFSGYSQNFGTVENAIVWYPSTYPLGGNYTTVNYYGYPSLSAGLVGYWEFEEASGNRYDATGNNNTITEADAQISNFADSTGNGYTLTNNNNSVTDGIGILSGSSVFNGSNNLQYTGGAIVAASSPITVCGWVYGSNLTGFDQRLFDDTSEYGIQLSTSNAGIWNSNFQVALYSPYPQWIDCGLQFINDQWNFFAITIDSSNNLTSYVNNQSATQVIDGNYGPWGSSIPTLGMGDMGYGYGAGLVGKLDEVGIWSRALSPTEITSLYNSGSANTYPFVGNPGLLTDISAYWNFDVLNFPPTVPIGSTTGIIEDCAYVTNGNTTWFKLPAGICDPSDQPKSYSLWFKLDQTSVGYQFLLCQGELSDQRNINPFYIEWNSTLSTVFTTNGYYWTNSIGTNIVPTANEWHHVVLTLNGNTAKLYYDGNLVGSTGYSGEIQSTNSRFTLGHYNPFPNGVNGPNIFAGKFDEFGIWNKELSLSEVLFIYNNRQARGLPYPYPYN